MSNTYVLMKGVASLDDLVDGFNRYPGANYLGRTYYVNNITGGSTNNGLSWKSAMDEVSTAITASEAWRQRASIDSGNEYVRNTIYVQGTSTAYTAITSLPSYADLIGIGGRFPQGNGAGIVRIGADTGTGESGLSGTSSVRGLRMSGIQFQAGNGGYAFQLSNIFGSKIHDCAFTSNSSPAGAPAAGVEIAIGGGLSMRDCLWMNQSSVGNSFDVGFDVTGTHFNGCTIQNCKISGADAAFRLAAGTINGQDSEVVNCRIGWGSETCAIGIDDNATVGHVLYTDLRIFATDPLELTHNAANRAIGCMSADGFVIT